MYITCKEEQIRLTGAPSYGCVLVISNIVRHNYKLNHNALKHEINRYIVSITLMHRYNYFTSRYYVNYNCAAFSKGE